MMYKPFLLLFALAASFLACRPEDSPSIDPDKALSGGPLLTTFDASENAFGHQANGLTFTEDGRFVSGNSLFQSNWVTAPASVQSLDGLGPMFNVSSCGGCHFKDGRAKPVWESNAPQNGLLFRLSVPGMELHGGPLGEPNYGEQLQDRAILDAKIEGKISITYTEIPGNYPDGSAYSLRKPAYTPEGLNFGDLQPDYMLSPRIAQQLSGLGLLEALPENSILALSDPADANGDGISGRPNYVWDASLQKNVLGRFGWKANQPNLKQQTAAAFNGDIGITSSIFPLEGFTPAQQQLYAQIPNGGSPELSDEQLEKVSFYLQVLAVPARRDLNDAQAQNGEILFAKIGCGKCHSPLLETDDSHPIAVLRNTKIRPYTDLLLHDMGPELADGRPDFLADGQEWRTQPLWGIGMIRTVNKHQFLLHDGRARNIEEAILWHGGEAQSSREAFKSLKKQERDDLLRFLERL